MESRSLKRVTKLPAFKINIFNLQIEITNFLKFSRADFWKLSGASAFTFILLLTLFGWPVSILLMLCFPKTAYLMIPYYIWMYLDRKTPATTGRKCEKKWFKDSWIFVSYGDYLSSNVVKVCDLPAGQNYLCGIFPHGTFPYGSTISLLSNATNVHDLFPGIEFRGTIHETLFNMPFARDLGLAMGLHSCSESSLKLLLNGQPSKCVFLYPGGAAEGLLTTPGSTYKIIRRKGFIRVALITGTKLVPVFNFGESNIYDVLFTYPTRLLLRKIVTHAVDFFQPNGRGIFQNYFGIMPKQHPVTLVVGQPIDVPKIANPSAEIIDEYHKKFFDALFALFEKYKHSCDVAGSDAKLIYEK